MNKHLILSMLMAGSMLMASAQSPDKFAYTVTDSVQNGVKWNFLRKIDLRTGDFSDTLLRLLSRNDTVPNSTLCNGVAAIALDDKKKRLYYTPMLLDRLSYVDLKTMKIHVVTNNFTGLIPKAADQSNIITRMVIAADDHGYALTNDGNHLVRFNTNTHQVVNLGALTDAANNSVSVHEVCSSYGGDIVADDEGILYLITSRNYVFKINVATRVAKYLGIVSGLPEGFGTSGVAVDYRGDNRVVITSAVNDSDIFSVDLETFIAVGLHAENAWHSSDLANRNILKTKKNNLHEELINADNFYVDKIGIYPNPVIANKFRIKFTNAESGTYKVELVDVLGEAAYKSTINTVGKINLFTIELPGSLSKGIYVIRINDKMNKTVFSEKIILQ